MSQQTPYGLTLTPSAGGPAIVIVAADGWIESAPVFEASQQLIESDGIKLINGFFRPLAGVSLQFVLTVEVDHADTLTAQNAFLDAGDDLLAIDGTLVLTPNDGGAVVTFTNALVADITPSLPSGIAATTQKSFLIQTSLPE